jgi:hypothetical protein
MIAQKIKGMEYLILETKPCRCVVDPNLLTDTVQCVTNFSTLETLIDRMEQV